MEVHSLISKNNDGSVTNRDIEMPEIPQGTTCTQPSDSAKATCNSDLITAVKDLATAVDMLAMKVHLFETHHAKIEVGMELLCTTLLRVEEITNKIASAKIVEKVSIPIAISDEEEPAPVGGSCGGCSSKRSRYSKSVSRRPTSKGIGDGAIRKTLASSVVSHELGTNFTTINGLHLSSSSLSPALSGVNSNGKKGVTEMPPPLLIGRPTMMFHQPRFSPRGDLEKNGSIRGHGKEAVPERNFSGDIGGANDGSGDRVKVFGSVMEKSPLTHVSPGHMKLPPENSLTEPQRWAASYAFDTQKNLMEELVKFGDFILTREDFLSLTPGAIPVDNIFHMFAMMLTKYNNCMEEPTFWCLPPSFSKDIRQGKSVKQLVADYSKTWMKPSVTLNYVYLPIKEESGLWYLMVIAFREGMLYYLDASMGEVEAMKRKSFIRKLGDDVAAIIGESTYEDFSTKAGCITCSGIAAANGLPIAQTRETSAIWVLNWMAMGGAFQRNLMPQMEENAVRLHTAVALLMAPFNDRTQWITNHTSTS
ncbi:uncharacterized protein DS421_5g144170 [Arachis hypogaea]|nr:uncharacterized protein DS421_5g144170 [Arachis hypogaea]